MAYLPTLTQNRLCIHEVFPVKASHREVALYMRNCSRQYSIVPCRLRGRSKKGRHSATLFA